MATIDWARDEAERLLAADARRLRHVRAVAARAEALAGKVLANGGGDQEVAVRAAWLHDVGYAAPLVQSGCHHLDGAAYVAKLGEERLAGLVAYHSSGEAEARLRGLGVELRRYCQERSLVADLLTYCDLSTGPDGTAMSLDRRLGEVERRYGADHVVVRGLRASTAALRLAFQHVEERLER